MNSDKFSGAKIVAILLLCLAPLLFNNNVANAAATFTSVSCGAPTATAAWPRNKFKSSCTVDVNIDNSSNVYVGVSADSYTTIKNSGNGTDLDYRQPEDPTYRFQADGPIQAGTPVNITTNVTGPTITVVKSNISANDSFNVDLYYTTYEADYGGTNYTQSFTFRLFKTSNNGELHTAADSMTFTIENKQYITASTNPSISLTSSADIFSSDQYFDSNSLTISVKANNTWKLQMKLAGNLIDGGNNIPITSTYFRCSGAGFDNLAAARTQFAVADTYYDGAQNNNGTNRTGTSDNINLDSVDVTVIYSLRTTALFDKGNYSTTSTFNNISPR